MQPNIVMAFRKRLKRFKYTNISINKIKNPENGKDYIITAVEALAKTKVKIEYSIVEMHNSFK